MSTKQDWRERWEEKDRDGANVIDVAVWSDGSAYAFRYREASGYEGISSFICQLIPRKPAPTIVPWEPDEVPVGTVVRMIDDYEQCGVITERRGDSFLVKGVYFTTEQLHDIFVLHQPKVDTKDCQPCGKVVKS